MELNQFRRATLPDRSTLPVDGKSNCSRWDKAPDKSRYLPACWHRAPWRRRGSFSFCSARRFHQVSGRGVLLMDSACRKTTIGHPLVFQKEKGTGIFSIQNLAAHETKTCLSPFYFLPVAICCPSPAEERGKACCF